MGNALAVTLGSNLGSTFSNWILVTVGFGYDIELLSLPVVAVAGIFMSISGKESKWRHWMKLLFSIGFLFIAFGYIKSGMEAFVLQTNLVIPSGYPLILFLLLGLLLTAVFQSSSATMAITLSALYSNAIDLEVAAAIVLGAEIGTTLKLFIAAAKGMPDKKRLALGNFLVNVVTVAFIFLLLSPITSLVTGVLQVQSELIALVLFQTIVNLASIILFLPLLDPLTRFLSKFYRRNANETPYISKVAITDTDLAMEALENETGNFIDHVIAYSANSFEIPLASTPSPKYFQGRSVAEQYSFIKQLYGTMHGFYLKLQNAASDKAETEKLDQLISAIRNFMYAAKNIADAQQDIRQVRNSSNDIKYGFYLRSRQQLQDFYKLVNSLLSSRLQTGLFDQLAAAYAHITKEYPETLKLLYKEKLAEKVSETEISTLINLNRELYTSYKSILFGLKDYLLPAKESAYFDSLPGFIR